MNRNSVFIHTYGCQMNERDSEELLGILVAQGYTVAGQAEQADVILLNTCSVRGHAEERAYGKMGELSVLKRQRPELVLGIIGCMAKLHQERIFKRLPMVDLIAGPAELYDLPYLLAEIQEKRQTSDIRLQTSEKVMAIGRQFRPLERKPAGDYRAPGVTAFVTIMEGCDKSCAYCIVPMTRGQEISRPAEEILEEIEQLVASGYRDITLLGQNVNSYGKRFPDGSGYKGPLGRLRLLEDDPDSLLDFPALLRMIDAVLQDASGSRRDGTPVLPPAEVGVPIRPDARFAPAWLRSLGAPPPPFTHMAGSRRPPSLFELRSDRCEALAKQGRPHGTPPRWRDRKDSEPLARRTLGRSAVRIRFTTSHPFDATERLFEAMRDCPSVCEALHLPVQSGSTRILRAMRRGYTREAYLEKIEALRRLVPDVSLSTDLIVGFPGETDEDFQQTLTLMREVEYDNAYIFKYSPRPGTDAAAREDGVPQEVKEERNQVLLSLQDDASLKRHQQFEGRPVEVLIEGPGKHPGQLFGRARGNHGVILDGPPELVGRLVDVTITRATAHTLFGTQDSRLKTQDLLCATS